jgi:RNA polymerase-binding transcription factor DksA
VPRRLAYDQRVPHTVDLTAARIALETERDRLRVALGVPIENPGQMTYGSQAAAATQVFEQQRDLALRDHERAQLAQVEAALQAIEAGTYGTCRVCGRPIASGRLEAIPWALVCIDDAAKARR